MRRRIKRKTVNRRDVIQALADEIDANDDGYPCFIWSRRCLTKAIEMLGGKVVLK